MTGGQPAGRNWRAVLSASGVLAALVPLLALVAAAGCQRPTAPATKGGMPFPFHHRVIEPRDLSSGISGSNPDKRPPLLLLLHGIGADENDLAPLAGMLPPQLKVVSLRAPHSYYTGRAWFQIEWRPDGTVIPDTGQARASLSELVSALETAPALFGTDPARTFVLGFSQGAMMSLGALHTAPGRLAGVMLLSGRHSEDLFPLAVGREAIARVPVLAAHGLYDEVLPVENGRRTKAAFEGFHPDFTYREFPVAHGISEDELEWIADWLEKRL